MFNLRIFSGNCNGKKLTVICKTAKILIVIRKSNHCIKTLKKNKIQCWKKKRFR